MQDVFVPDLKHEGRMYDRLRSIQGTTIPVYLGNINSTTAWHDLEVHIVHMLLMSWGGESIMDAVQVRHMEMDVKRFEDQTSQLGFQHEELTRDNIWSVSRLPMAQQPSLCQSARDGG